MNNIESLPKHQLKHQIVNGLRFRLGCFNICLTSSIADVSDHIQRLYGPHQLINENDFIDFHVDLSAPSKLRRYFRPQVSFYFDGYVPFKPLPYAQAAAFFEWGLNWCIANHSNQYLIMHAAVVERNGLAFIFPGTPGSGKSTLCAALVCSGWRLLSDEMTLLSMTDGKIYPVPRPVSLKNKSIEVIQQFSPGAEFGQLVTGTAKGSISHMCAPEQSIQLSNQPAVPSKLIFPKYTPDSETELTPLSKGRAMLSAAENAFNYSVLGVQGFEKLAEMIEQCDCFEFKYSKLEEAIALFSALSDEQ
ncbi:MAG: HprK-related kinase A [Methylococcaceae bacterium]|nr:HprK-related kinase A [Methylococcaceae bacterium]MDZ4157272.1 HprK-related kinase A [Methylococcales bacterium]MDP2392562.1 HprK-related kinase A [Methylococcaceae bacterium]MDP3021062.1 HprK-related kinase A [Methylococcaceae bacterium]MDP3388449.1 HprK-related kinase A [Methylococcaceae bacterium]